MTPDTKTLSQIAALKLALQDLETRAMYGKADREGRTYAAVLNAVYDLTEIDAVYDAFRDIDPDCATSHDAWQAEADFRYEDKRDAA